MRYNQRCLRALVSSNGNLRVQLCVCINVIHLLSLECIQHSPTPHFCCSHKHFVLLVALLCMCALVSDVVTVVDLCKP